MTNQPTASAQQPVRYLIQLPDGLRPLRLVRGREGLSQTFRFELELRMEQGQASLGSDELARAEVVLVLQREQITQRTLRGVVTEVRISASRQDAPELKLVVEPLLALLRHRTDCRVFRDKSVPEIVDEVLGTFEWRAEWRLAGSYAPRPYCVQFRESDFDFISRLLEEEGIFYFVPDWDAERSAEDGPPPPIVVFGDSPSAYPPIAGDSLVPFAPGHGMDVARERVTAIGWRRALGVGEVTLRDFNPDMPGLDMEVHAPGPSEGSVEYYDYPGEYQRPEQGAHKAQRMSEGFGCAAAELVGRADCSRLRPGGRFELADAPAGVDDGGYVVRELRHDWRRDEDDFALALALLPEDVAYRPLRQTPAPVVCGLLAGYVTGPEGSDIHCDEMGRVKVHFPWDRLQAKDDDCSHWVPVLQDNTGFSSAIPRVGWEVAVAMLEGDPDRPVVLGRMYNAADTFPEPLPEGKTRSALKSLTSPGRGGSNELRFDDAAGKELVYLQAERDQNVHVANDALEEVLNREGHYLEGDESLKVGANSATVVGQDHAMTVLGSQSINIGGSRQRQVGANDTTDISGHRFVTIGGLHFRRNGANDNVTTGVLSELVGALDLEASLKANTTDAESSMGLAVAGALVELSLEDKSENAKGKRVETIGGLYAIDAAAEISLRAELSRATTVGGSLSVEGDDQVLLTGASSVTVTSGGGSSYQGSSAVTFTVGASSVSFAGGTVAIETGGNITLDGGGALALLGPTADLSP